jgi:hypothetical protein
MSSVGTHKAGSQGPRLRRGFRRWLAGGAISLAAILLTASCTPSGPVYALRLYDASRNTFTAPTTVPGVGGSTLDVVQPTKAGVSTSALSTATKVTVGGVSLPFKFIAPPHSATGSGAPKGLFNQFGDLRVTLPPHAPGTVSVVVTEPGFTSSPLPLKYAGSGPVYALRLYDASLNKFAVPTVVSTVGGSTLDVVQPGQSGVKTSALSTATKVTVGGVPLRFTFIAPPQSSAGTGSGAAKGLFNQFGDLRVTLPPHAPGTVSVVVSEPGFTGKPLPLKYG